MALSENQEIYVPAPNTDHTLCLYAFGELAVQAFQDGTNNGVSIGSKGYYCVVVKKKNVLVSN